VGGSVKRRADVGLRDVLPHGVGQHAGVDRVMVDEPADHHDARPLTEPEPENRGRDLPGEFVGGAREYAEGDRVPRIGGVDRRPR